MIVFLTKLTGRNYAEVAEMPWLEEFLVSTTRLVLPPQVAAGSKMIGCELKLTEFVADIGNSCYLVGY